MLGKLAHCMEIKLDLSSHNICSYMCVCVYLYTFLKDTRYLFSYTILVNLGQGKFSFQEIRKAPTITLKIAIFDYIAMNNFD